MTKRFDYEIGDFVADKFGNVYKVLDIDDSFRIPVRVEIVERKTETYFCGNEPSTCDETWPLDKKFALHVVNDKDEQLVKQKVNPIISQIQRESDKEFKKFSEEFNE